MTVADLAPVQLLGLIVLANSACFFTVYIFKVMWHEPEYRLKRQKFMLLLAFCGMFAIPAYAGLTALSNGKLPLF